MLLLHTCCAPCSVKCIDVLSEKDFNPVVFWYNPNIHPWSEYNARKIALIGYCARKGVDILVEDKYGLREFIKDVYPDFGSGRCAFCYKKRIEETARRAARENYSSFSTTLLISPYQKHDFVKNIALEAAEKYSVEFVYIDFRPEFREGQRIARSEGIYMQKYCGCIFSEEERYSS